MREQLRQIKLWKVIFAAVGILLVGTGVAFNARAALGNDPIGIIYDGVRNAANVHFLIFIYYTIIFSVMQEIFSTIFKKMIDYPL